MDREGLEHVMAELKDVSELMIDLAYGALLYQDEDLSEEVRHLEDHVDRLTNQAQLAAVHLTAEGGLDPLEAVAFIRLATASEQVADSARDLANMVVRDVEPHPVLRVVVEESDIVIRRVRIHRNSGLDGSTVKEAQVETKTGMHIFAMRRGDTWELAPSADTELAVDDVLLARGPAEGTEGLWALVGADEDDLEDEERA